MSLYTLPLNRAIERRLCRDHYAAHEPSRLRPDGSVEEQLCKIDAVQKTLGSMLGAMETMWIVGDFVMTLPLGFVAQRRGRRVVLLLNLVSRAFMLSWAVLVGWFDGFLPVNAIIAGPVLSFLGGDCVFNSLTYALVSDLTEDPVQRAISFGYMSSVSYVVALLGPAMASATMSLVLWLPFVLGLCLLCAAVPVVAVLPDGRQRVAGGGDEAEEEGQRQHLLSSPVLKAQDARRGDSVLQAVAEHGRELWAIVASHPRNFSLLLFSFFLTSLASSDTKMLPQYISVKFRWTFASTGYLLSGKAVVNFVLLTVVIPRLLLRRRAAATNTPEDAGRFNMQSAKACLVVSIIGALGIAVAGAMWMLVPALLVYALGSALPIFTLSLLKSPAISPPRAEEASSSAESHIFSIVMLCKTVGSLLGAPLMATLWVGGIGIGGLALGMPYFVSATCYLAAIGVFTGIKLD
ncbi:major facilitator superfamily domain-containing protein [Stachybotrys elegans]|uniref:Major facilitator superfamily domain-containing protein n=1 Tax=Stachybotrys elegans TaxID=80388 RepID=A0A8K0WTM3_9HYPO|nr:major facilitator superfamily domain-containing protein [Stachybotrys elegans]